MSKKDKKIEEATEEVVKEVKNKLTDKKEIVTENTKESVTKTKVKIEKTICGIEEKKIRKYFAKKEMEKLWQEVEQHDNSEKDIIELGEFLNDMEEKNKKNFAKFSNTFNGKIFDEEKEIEPPTIEDIEKGIGDDKAWREKADQSIDFVERHLKKIEDAANGKGFLAKDFWLTLSSAMLPVERIIHQDYIHKKQLFSKLAVTYRQKFGCSWTESQAMARTNKVYAEYKKLQKLVGDTGQQGLLERMEMLNKKYDAKEV